MTISQEDMAVSAAIDMFNAICELAELPACGPDNRLVERLEAEQRDARRAVTRDEDKP